MKAHNNILGFVPSGMCEININRENIEGDPVRGASSKDEQRTTSKSSLGESTPIYHYKYHYSMSYLLASYICLELISLKVLVLKSQINAGTLLDYFLPFYYDLDDIC